MWLVFALLGQFLLAGRRSTEKQLSVKIDTATMSWLQQAVSLPFMIALLPFAAFYNPLHLSGRFYVVMVVLTVFYAFDTIFYFKALSVGDISVIAPLITVAAVSAVIGSYFILGQKPSLLGLLALSFVVLGAVISTTRRAVSHTAINNTLAIYCTLGSIVIRGVISPLELVTIRLTNPIYYNFISSVFLIPTVILVGYGLRRIRPSAVQASLRSVVSRHRWGLAIVGFTYTGSLSFNYYAKTLAPNAGYITAVRTGVVLPMVFIGAVVFHEHISKRQWAGVVTILIGLTAFAFV